MKRVIGALLIVGGLTAALTACSTDQGSTSQSATVTLTAPTPAITDVDLVDYAIAGSPGYFHWTYAGGKECYSEAASNGRPARIGCAATFPADTPSVKNDVFTGPPNTVVLTAASTEATINEGGPPGAKVLAPNTRISVEGMSCTALDKGIVCKSPGAGFSIDGNTLVRTGNEQAPTTVPATP